MLGIRKKLAILGRLAALAALPDMVKQSLQQSLQQFVERTQSSLESSARNDRTGRMLDIVRRNRVCVPDTSGPMSQGAASDPPNTATASGAAQPRRIILT